MKSLLTSSLLFVGLVMAIVVLFVTLSPWPVARSYGISAVSIVFMWLVAWKAIHALPRSAGRAAFQFSLGTLLVWVVPYAAVVAWILGRPGPHDQDFLNASSKAGMLVILTQAWVCAYVIARMMRSQRAPKPPIISEDRHSD